MSTPADLAGQPPLDTPVPAGLQKALKACRLEAAQLSPVWRNGVGGLTFSVASGGAGAAIDFYAKWNPEGTGESLTDEVERLLWIQGRHPAPTVVDLVTAGGDEVLLTRALPGRSAVSQQWQAEPKTALQALGAGLRRLHSLALDQCPFDWGVEHRIRSAAIVPDMILQPPSIDRLVVCQGDPCAPNTLLAADGSFLAHVDLARLGVADRWADLAVMSMSLEWNYHSYDETDFWDAYGVAPDSQRIDYYRKLWNTE